jgi:hypothetical protein
MNSAKIVTAVIKYKPIIFTLSTFFCSKGKWNRMSVLWYVLDSTIQLKENNTLCICCHLQVKQAQCHFHLSIYPSIHPTNQPSIQNLYALKLKWLMIKFLEMTKGVFNISNDDKIVLQSIMGFKIFPGVKLYYFYN